MRLNYIDLKHIKESNGQTTFTLDSLTETEFLQSLSDEKREQIQKFNALQSLVRDPDQTELNILAYKSRADLNKNDKIMLVYIRDKTYGSHDKNSRAFESAKSRHVDIMLPYFIDRIYNITNIYGLVCHTLKLLSVNPVALTAMDNFKNIGDAFKTDNYNHGWYKILDLRDLLIDQTSEPLRAFRTSYNELWLAMREDAKIYNNHLYNQLIFAPLTLGNIQEKLFQDETLLIWDSSGEDYVNDDSIELYIDKTPYIRDEIIIPLKINLSSSESIDRLFGFLVVGLMIKEPDPDLDQHQSQYKLDLVDFLSLGENIRTMQGLFMHSKFESQIVGQYPVCSGYKTILFIDVDKLKNLESMDELCEESQGLTSLEIVNLRPGISMNKILENSEVNSISLTGSINADDIATLFEKSCNIYQIDLSNLTINTSTDSKELERLMVKIFWRISTKHTKLILNSDTYNKAPQVLKALKRERDLFIKIVD